MQFTQSGSLYKGKSSGILSFKYVLRRASIPSATMPQNLHEQTNRIPDAYESVDMQMFNLWNMIDCCSDVCRITSRVPNENR
jgi:hypothetical protein